MQVIPSVNEPSFEGVVLKIRQAENFLPHDGWVHLDISDGVFGSIALWNNPDDLYNLKTFLNIEAHLMIDSPEDYLEDWLGGLQKATTGKKRIIVHFEAMSRPDYILEECAKFSTEPGLALNPTTSGDIISVYLSSFKFLEALAVTPGASGQTLDVRILDKIRFLRSKSKDVIIEVDGGINRETAAAVKEAGADIVVSGSYIFNNPSPKASYEELASV